MCPESSFRIAPNWPLIEKMTMTSQIVGMPSPSNCFDVFLFLLSSLLTGPSFMSISSLVLELWEFPFTIFWPESRKSEIPPSEFCPISGDWSKLWIPHLARMSPIKYYWMLQNSRVSALTVTSTYSEEYLRTVASENVFMKLRKIKINS